jgi:hypothetical protein
MLQNNQKRKLLNTIKQKKARQKEFGVPFQKNIRIMDKLDEWTLRGQKIRRCFKLLHKLNSKLAVGLTYVIWFDDLTQNSGFVVANMGGFAYPERFHFHHIDLLECVLLDVIEELEEDDDSNTTTHAR